LNLSLEEYYSHPGKIMNIFAILSMIIFPLYVVLGWYVFNLEPRARINKIFLLFSACFAFWAFTFTFFYTAPDVKTAWFWYNLSAIGRILYPALLLNLALIFTNNRFNQQKWYYSAVLYLPAIVFLYAVLSGPFITQDLVLIDSSWYEILITNSGWWYAYNIYYLLYVPLAFILMGWWGYRSKSNREKMQALIIILTGAVSFSLGIISNTLLPLLDIFILPSMAQIFGVIFFLGIAYAIVKYKLLKLTAATAAEDIITKITDMIILMDTYGKIIRINRRTQNLLGYSESNFEGKTWEFIVQNGDESAKIRKYLEGLNEQNQYKEESNEHKQHEKESNERDSIKEDSDKLKINFQRKNGEEIPVNIFLSPIRDDVGLVGVLLVAQDMRQTRKLEHEITEKVKAQQSARIQEEKLIKSLEEKEILLKEIHHRVKNNMQIISSLLNLQSGYLKDKGAVDALKDCQGRIMSMAMIHENLYRSKPLTGIKFKDYIDFLVKNIFHTYNVNTELFEVDIDADEVYLDIDTAIPCGLIINELLTNSIKHAYPEGTGGQLNIKIDQDDGKYYLQVADDGMGLPAKLDITNTGSLGLLLVNSLVKQLEGKLEVYREKGTIFQISFKKVEYPKRIP
jgi:two-component sensor histidine kinase